MLLVEGSPLGYGNLQGDFNRTGTLRGRYAAGKDRGRQCEGPDAIAARSAWPVPLRCLQIQRNGAIGDIEDFAAPPYRMA